MGTSNKKKKDEKVEKKVEEQKKPYSYHTFILPMTWDCEGDKYAKMVRSVENNPNWKCTDMVDENYADTINLYKESQYFYPYARRAIYGQGKNVVRNFSFQPEGFKGNAKYLITDNGNKYELDVTSLEVKIFNTGIILWILRVENSKDEQRNIKTVKAINEFGRRVALPFIGKNARLCANMLKLEWGEESLSTDFENHIKRTLESNTSNVPMLQLAGFIKDTLGYGYGNFEYKDGIAITTKENANSQASGAKQNETSVSPSETIKLAPVLDDRMYVQCLVTDKAYVDRMLGEDNGKKLENDPDYPFVKDDRLSSDLYELVYIDLDGNVTVYNKGMKKRLIDKALYERWMNYEGSMYFNTEYSFIYVTGTEFEPVKESFLSQYYQMFCLVIAQRSSLIRFKRDAAKLSLGLEKPGEKIRKDRIVKIMGLMQQFVAFEGELCFDEVSPQQQGMEMFEKLKEAFLIEKEKASLKSQLESLYNVANTSIGFDTNLVVLIFTWIAAIISVASMLIAALQISGVAAWLGEPAEHVAGQLSPVGSWVSFIIAASGLIGLAAVFLILFIYRRKR